MYIHMYMHAYILHNVNHYISYFYEQNEQIASFNAIIALQDIKIASAKSKNLVDSEEGLEEEQQELAASLRAKVISQV